MKDDLEARENGVKRPRDEDEGDEERLEREIRRLAEDGKRRRKEREEALRRDMQKEAETNDSPAQTPGSSTTDPKGAANASSGVSEIDRTVKVRWAVAGDGGSITAEHIKGLFSQFGQIESADLLNPKMLRLGKKQKKQLAVACMIQYKSIVGAHAAIEDFPKQQGPQWERFDSVFWAANKEPEFLSQQSNKVATDSTPTTPTPKGRIRSSFGLSGLDSQSSTPSASPKVDADGLRKKPSFASFSPGFNTPKESPFGKGLGTNSPSLEEMTMIRLKNAEKKRLAAELERQDREADAAKAAQAVNGA